MQTQRGEQSIAVLILKLSAKWWWLVKAMTQPLEPWEKAMVSTIQEPGHAWGTVWTRVGSLDPSGFELQTIQLLAN